jgi:hypothetical protein
VREVAHDGLGARSALVACHDAFERRVTVCKCSEKRVAWFDVVAI